MRIVAKGVHTYEDGRTSRWQIDWHDVSSEPYSVFIEGTLPEHFDIDGETELGAYGGTYWDTEEQARAAMRHVYFGDVDFPDLIGDRDAAAINAMLSLRERMTA